MIFRTGAFKPLENGKLESDFQCGLRKQARQRLVVNQHDNSKCAIRRSQPFAIFFLLSAHTYLHADQPHLVELLDFAERSS